MVTKEVTKEALCEKICEILGVKLESLERMTKEDLVQLHEVLSKLLKPLSDMSVREILNGIFGDKPIRERIFPRARKRLREILAAPEKKEEKEEEKRENA